MFSRRGRWGGSTPFALLEISGEEGRRKKEEVTANSAERARETERENVYKCIRARASFLEDTVAKVEEEEEEEE